MVEQTILITGATSGLGRYLAEHSAEAGLVVLVHGRDERRATELVNDLRATGATAHGYVADLTSLRQVRRLAEQVSADHPALAYLVNNAGVGSAGDYQVTADGNELHFAVNYLAPYLLTRSLLPALRAGAPARVVNVGSIGQSSLDFDDLDMRKHYDGQTAYTRSKLALAMFSFDLAEELRGADVTSVVVHPATYMDTAMVRDAGIAPWNTVEHGGKATMRVILDPELADTTGIFFDEDQPSQPHQDAHNPIIRRRLHDLTQSLT